ncbi:heavy-metal-associated domain-containing protein [Flavobacterium sp. JP2137]|uniref:heavy-metal-associated domain-containing protein n=1 Tax=Flavobacterium sp. JP2137 TaxID=3414510 RepID=UPI003D2FA894
MEDKKFQFKTNINCSSCVSKVTPFLNEVEGIGQWDVDTTDRYKVLTVVSNGISEQEVVETVLKAGFKIEAVSE